MQNICQLNLFCKELNMEIPSIDTGDKEKRRVNHGERRTDANRHRASRRKAEDRRYDRLGRFIVSLFLSVGLKSFADQVRLLSERSLLGPVFMFLSAIIAFLLYAGEQGVVTGAVLVIGLMIHESGHFLATKWCKLRPHWWWFFPFLGAIMRLSDVKTRNQEATIALGGPLLGGVVSLAAYGLWLLAPFDEKGNLIVFQFALLTTFLNLFNLIPISPLDGGRITQASHTAFQWFGFAVLLLVSWFFRQPVLLLVWIVVVVDRFLDYPLWRFVTALCFLGAMAVLLYLGYGTPSVMENITFLAFGAFLVAMCRPNEQYHVHRRRREKVLPLLPLRSRIGWGLTWLMLFGTLLVLLAELILKASSLAS